jgi:hypothetical protein
MRYGADSRGSTALIASPSLWERRARLMTR